MIHTQLGRGFCVLATLLTAFVGSSTRAHSQDFILRTIVEPGDVIDGLTILRIENSTPTMSAAGEVAFVATVLDGVEEKRGIFTQDRVIALQGENIDGVDMLGFSTGPGSMNKNGDLAFAGVFAGSPRNEVGVFFAPGPTTPGTRMLVASPGDVIGGETLDSTGWPTMDDAGNIVFTGFINDLSSPYFGHGLYTTTHPLVRKGDVIDGVTMSGRSFLVQLSGGGELRFMTALETPGDPVLRHSIFSDSAMLARGGTTIGGHVLDEFLDVPSVGPNGEVVFQATFPDVTTGEPVRGYYSPQDVLVLQGDVVDGVELTGFPRWPAVVLDNGGLLFAAQVSLFDRGLFTLDRALVLPGEPVQMKTGAVMPLRTVQQVAGAVDGRFLFLGFIDGPQEVLTEAIPADADGDGVPDDIDECLDSIVTETVVIGACDSRVTNLFSVNGCTVSDDVSACAESAGSRRGFRTCVADLARSLRRDGLSRPGDGLRLWFCAAVSRLP